MTQQAQLSETEAQLTVGPMPEIESDRFALEQIFANLIDNAVKYRRDSVPLTIDITAEDLGSKVRVSVADNGRGIAPADHERIFDLFRRAGTQEEHLAIIGHLQARDGAAAAALKKMAGVKVVEEEKVPETDACEKTMESMINLDSASLLFPTSYGYFSPHTLKLAKKYPKARFEHAGGLWTDKDPKNVGSYFGYIDEAQYVAGIVAGHSTKSGKLGFVGTGTSGAFAAANPSDVLFDLLYALRAGYRQNANFLMARRTMRDIRKLKDGQGNYLVDLRLRDGALVESIFGFGVTTGEDMPAIAANAFPIAFGDFAEAYTIVDRLGTSVVRDNITQPGFVKYHMRRRVGGGAVNFEALKFFKIATS
mgnify:CR=1 FL=1